MTTSGLITITFFMMLLTLGKLGKSRLISLVYSPGGVEIGYMKGQVEMYTVWKLHLSLGPVLPALPTLTPH